ncbi:MAG: hypothetical protein VX738_11300 [Planctomycetota bacterium]|nr:hypothetical protein [Planctomycetota bacterium]
MAGFPVDEPSGFAMQQMANRFDMRRVTVRHWFYDALTGHWPDRGKISRGDWI